MLCLREPTAQCIALVEEYFALSPYWYSKTIQTFFSLCEIFREYLKCISHSVGWFQTMQLSVGEVEGGGGRENENMNEL